MTHLDYDASLPKAGQRYRQRRDGGVTLGDLVDAVGELFERDSEGTRFVMVESVRSLSQEEEEEERPRTKGYMPGLSAEESLSWQ